jgi:PAS domain S-box-containing protein
MLEKILLVDDSEQWTVQIKGALTQLGYSVDVACNGLEAVSKCHQTIPDIVLLDYLLPKVDGGRAARLIKRLPECANIKIILLTGLAHHLPEKALECIDLVIAKDRLDVVVANIDNAIKVGEFPPGPGGRGKAFSSSNDRRKISAKMCVLLDHQEKLYESMGEVVFETDENGLVLHCSSRSKDILNLNEAQIIGYPIDKLLSLSSENELWQAFLKVRLGLVDQVRNAPLSLGGKAFSCAVSMLTLDSSENRLLLVMQDETERFTAERELHKSRFEFEQLFDSAAGALCVLNTDYSIKNVNQSYCELTGYSREELLGKRCCDMFRSKNCGTPNCCIKKASRGEFLEAIEMTKFDNEGNKFICSLSTVPQYDRNGTMVGILQDFRDITERKRLESISEAMNVADNLGYVFSGIRHEIGNPINTTKMALSVLKANLDTFSPETVREYIERVQNEMGRVEFLLKTLKSFSLFEVVSPQKEDLHLFVGKFLDLIKDECEKHGVNAEAKNAPATKYAVFDSRVLHQVMLNLFTNSIDALADTNKPQITVRTTTEGNDVVITLEDNGCGMTDKQKENLFKPFRTTKEKGTGLGLSISKKLIAKMRGTLTFESVSGYGTKATITLPHANGVNI